MALAYPDNPTTYVSWTWEDVEPYFKDLEGRTLSPATLQDFLQDWSELTSRVADAGARLYVATTQNTADEEATSRFRQFVENVQPNADAASQRLRQKLLGSGLEPENFTVQMRNMRVEAELFREENLPLETEERKLEERYYQITGAQTVMWKGEEIPIIQLSPVSLSPDRAERQAAFEVGAERRLRDRQAIDDLWREFVETRLKIAANAGFPDYRSYKWKQLKRFDYTPDDAKQLHAAVEEFVVPVAARLYARRKEQLGVDRLRPWDLQVDPLDRPPLHPFTTVDELEEGCSSMFHRVDPVLGDYFDRMRRDGLLDLDSRKNKAPGGYCHFFQTTGEPFIFMSAVGMQRDVETVLHEGGHAFHGFEAHHLPYVWQRDTSEVGHEVSEVASMSMEFLASPYLEKEQGGFYSRDDAARARLRHLESALQLWVGVAVGDAFQHWIYENPEQAGDPDAVSREWLAINRRFDMGVDWDGYEDVLMYRWHAILHFHVVPFYYIDYGLAQLGAVQVWANALKDQAAAVRQYRHALSLGATVTVPEFYQAAGVRFAFDRDTVRQAVSLMERTIEELEEQGG